MAKMRYSISNTAEYGDYVSGPLVVTDETKAAMKGILERIQNGEFAKDWMLENRVNAPHFKAMRRMEAAHPIEEVGARLRKMFSWIQG